MLHARQVRRRELLDIYSFAVYHRERDLMALIVEESLRDPLLEQMILNWHIDEPLYKNQWLPHLFSISL